jgi:O-antigen ligase
MFIFADKREKIRNILVFLIMCIAFSIPFGEQYGKKILALTFVIWIFFVTLNDLKNVFKNKVIVLLTLFILSHYTTLFLSEDVGLGLHYISQMWRYIFIPIVIYITVLKKEHIQYVLYAFIFSMFINEIISYLSYFNIYQTAYSKGSGYPVGFINHIQYSVLVAFSAILILYQSRNFSNKYMKVVYTIFFITMTINLVISGGRTGYVVYFVSLFVLVFTYYKPTLKNLLHILLFPTIVFYIGYKYNGDIQARVNATALALQQIEDSRNYNTSLGTRIAFYPLAYDILSQEHNSFIFGVGMGDIEKELHKAIDRTQLINAKYDQLHSSYLTAYLHAGILGITLLFLFLFSLFRLKIFDKEFKFIQYLFLLNFTIGMSADILMNQRTTMIYFSVFIGIILSKYILENSYKKVS